MDDKAFQNNTKLSFFLTVSLLSLLLIHVVNLKIQVSCIIVFSVYYNARRKAMCVVCVVKYIIGSCICALYPSTLLVHTGNVVLWCVPEQIVAMTELFSSAF